MKISCLLFAVFLFSFSLSRAQNDISYQRIYLSGKDAVSAVMWDFKVSDGQKAGHWSQLPVPSNWELHGFGTYNYGHDHRNKERILGKEIGFYKHEFAVPQAWKDKRIKLVFAGSMTDTEAKINGKAVGEMHQGGFYEFKYDVTDLLKYGKKNILEVQVAKHSANKSVNNAERESDFWLFGGIYRPVYLEVLPNIHFSRIAIDAQASGAFNALLTLNQPARWAAVHVQITDIATQREVTDFQAPLTTATAIIRKNIAGIVSWNPENPKLYDAKFTLLIAGKPVYSKTERIGFRTVDLRKNDGLYVNDTKVVLKGVNRHSFYPTTGRALSDANHLEDIRLIQEMHMNAVRMSHYPPDERFLALCDSLGLFVLDEVTGWQAAYDTIVGPKLIKETVLRDENHPSVILWDHGNEGGWNFANERWFHQWDIQKRPVIYPWLNRNGIDAFHYPFYKDGINRLSNGSEVFMPTEMLHGLYDGGHGAGLDDFWSDYMKNPRAAGGFLWSFVDEAVIRTDRGDSLDADGTHAPDGILGPYREKEGSYYTIKEIWSPIQIAPMVVNENYQGELLLENRYLYTNLKGFYLNWKLKGLDAAWKIATRFSDSLQLTDILPGERKQVKLDLPADFGQADWLEVQVSNRAGEAIHSWTWPIHLPNEFVGKAIAQTAQSQQEIVRKSVGNDWVYAIGDMEVYFDKDSFMLHQVVKRNHTYALSGPLLPSGNVLKEVKQEVSNDGHQIIHLRYSAYPEEVTWCLQKNGQIKLEVQAPWDKINDVDYLGIHFSFPESDVKSIKWIGNGPYRVWQNRLKGPKFGVWEKAYNNSITGYSPIGKLVYPEFKGYHANLYAYQLATSQGNFKVYTETPGLFFRLFTPEQAPAVTEHLKVPFPPGDLSFLYKIPAIGTKFHAAVDMGPQSAKARVIGHHGDQNAPIVLWFDFD